MSDYFKTLNSALHQAHFALPTLIIDKARLDGNLAQVKQMLPRNARPRLVVKSLSSIELLQYTAKALDCHHFMVFHLPHITHVLRAFPQGDILLGKPMPIAAVRNLYLQPFSAQHPQCTQTPIQWLIDNMARLQQYLVLAQAQQIQLSINLEIDVGLHRGGVQSLSEFKKLLTLIRQNPDHLQLSGLMGYDAHVGKIPKLLQKAEQSYAQSQAVYQRYIDCIAEDFHEMESDTLCFNGAGSPTFSLHTAHSVCNDLSFGSMLLKPTDFDLPTLEDFEPALWIATPVLKKLASTSIPGISVLGRLPLSPRALFVYGGNWQAEYVFPEGAKLNQLYGRSSNQELINVPKSAKIHVDDFVFLRPTQSECVVSQFEQILLYNSKGFTTWHSFI